MKIREDFRRIPISERLYWLNEPNHWEISAGSLVIYPDKTDFWQKTHYGFSFDNGHALVFEVGTDFSLSTQVRFFPRNQYDQAGLMIRIDQDFWVKTSVEYENPNLSRLGVVVTNFGYSDWSTQDFAPNIQEIILKIIKNGLDYQILFRTKETDYSQLRIAHLHKNTKAVQCGLYACSPIETGFKAEFQYLEVETTLHQR